MTKIKVPCPYCVLRGPVWLDVNRKCVYCEEIITASDDWIWRAVPWAWWLEEGMIKEGAIPEAVKITDEGRAALAAVFGEAERY